MSQFSNWWGKNFGPGPEMLQMQDLAPPKPPDINEEAKVWANQQAAPLFANMKTYQEMYEPILARRTHAGYASRGFGLSGIADDAIKENLTGYRTEEESKRQNILNQFIRDYTDRAMRERELAQAQANADAQQRAAEEAAKPKGFFASLFS